jgi:hypothetical protein
MGSVSGAHRCGASGGLTSTTAGFSPVGNSTPGGGSGGSTLPEPSSICRRMLSSVAEIPSARGSHPSGVCSLTSGSTECSPKFRCTVTWLSPLAPAATSSQPE